MEIQRASLYYRHLHHWRKKHKLEYFMKEQCQLTDSKPVLKHEWASYFPAPSRLLITEQVRLSFLNQAASAKQVQISWNVYPTK